jgi:hypothetical protein
MYNGHFFGVPRVAVVDRFDCTFDLMIVLAANTLFMRSKVANNAF